VSPLSSSQAIVRFGDFEADLRSGELHKRGIRVKLQVQPFQVLQILLERAGEMVTREEIQNRIWPSDTFVDFDQGLNNAVKKLREALGDNAEKPRFIETLSKRGYRFIGTVQNGAAVAAPHEAPLVVTQAETTAQEPHRRGSLWGLALGVAVVAALVLVIGLNTGGVRDRLFGKSTAPRIQSLAVLPLQNLSNDPAQEYFSDGMTDSLITDLAQIGSLKVISRTSSMQYKQTKKSLPEIARELNVDGIVEGTVQRSGDRVRITAQLIQGTTDKHLWANSYERNLSDVLALERDLTQEIAREIQGQVKTPSTEPVAPLRPVDLNVLEAYLQGNYLLSRMGHGAGDELTMKAAEYFQQAIDADPSFAPAYLGKARAYGSYRMSSEYLAIDRKAAQRAVDLDPTLSDAWVELGDIHCLHDWDWPSAEKEYRRAIALNPNNASAHKSLGDFLSMMGRLDEALKEYQLTQERDPTQDYLSSIIYLRGDHDRAIELLRKDLEIHPDEGWNHLTLHRWLAVKGMHKESVQEMEKGLTLFGFPEIAARVHLAFASSGYKAAMLEAAKQFERLQAKNKVFFPMTLAQLYAGIGDKDRAFYWMEQAYEHRDRIGGDFGLELVRFEPMLDPLRSDPRFDDLMRRVGLPPQIASP
jgi:TolB-like protein/DNA-binding winged helix-turn-helix (wHTH) protein/Tfp pilus assembly protein PilF